MSLCTLNTQAVTFLQEGRPHEGVSLLLEAFERLDLVTSEEGRDNDSQSSDATSTSSGSNAQLPKSSNEKQDTVDAASNDSQRNKDAVNRAMEAHLRLSQSRSVESNDSCANLLESNSVDSDLSDLSANTGGDTNTLGTELAVLPSVDEEIDTLSGEDEEEESTSSSYLSQSGALLQSVQLPNFHDSSDASEDEKFSASDNIFTFYQRAFLLTGHDEEEEDSPKRAPVLLYNMAVAHHNYAMSSRHSDRVAAHREFQTALVFYDMCFNIIQDSWADDEDFLLLLCAVWNNKGHIHAYRCNYLETQEMLTSLQEILEVISTSSLRENPDFLFFYRNLVVYEEQEFASAPAA